jgi:hypothetical protein
MEVNLYLYLLMRMVVSLLRDYIFYIERVMVFNATFNNISVISWRSVLLLEETTDLPPITLSHNVVSSTPRLNAIRTHNVRGDRH